MRLATAEQLRSMERYAAEELMLPPTRLMDAAAEALLEASLLHLPEGGMLVILCGPGNNGADGYTLARLCYEHKIHCAVIAVLPAQSDLCLSRARLYARTGLPLYTLEGPERELCLRLLSNADVLVDCVFGIGFSSDREIPESFSVLVHALSKLDTPILCADVPSGLNADDGSFALLSDSLPALVFATKTLTFSFSKPGLETPPGIHAAGEIQIASVGLPDAAASAVPRTATLLDKQTLRWIPPRKPDTSKASFGRLCSVCGSDTMTGAAALCAEGALASGVGLLTCASRPHVIDVLQNRLLEPVFLPFPETLEHDTDLPATLHALEEILPRQTAILIGCGFGTGKTELEILKFLLSESVLPVVADADALTLLASNRDLLEQYGERMILTPHPGEMARLCREEPEQIQRARIASATAFARKYGCTIVLKGYRTVIASPDGSIAINPTGNPGMAKAGMGDLLAGMVAGFVAQKLPFFDAACLSVYLHARAGDLAKEQFGETCLLPHHLPTFLPAAMRE